MLVAALQSGNPADPVRCYKRGTMHDTNIQGLRLLALTTALAALAACGGGGGGDSPAPAPAPTGPDLATRSQAAATTAQSTSNACGPIRPFYWEIGDKTQRLGSGSVHNSGALVTYDADSQMSIASASKWLYGAYVAERRGGTLTAQDIQFLSFRSGYTNFGFSGCEQNDTVASCLTHGDNALKTDAHVDKFLYNGGHMQVHANFGAPGMALGALDNAALATEVRRVLGNDINLSYTQPQLAGGARTSAANYAVFLRKILNNQLRIAALLGSNATCTNPATCATALGTPVPSTLSWSYSMGHWVETDPVSGDGAFSSAGAFGFYPWVDAGKTWYGIVARLDAAGGGADSAACGGLIRKAWVTGTAQ
jgi:hypothetical protein